MAEPVFLDTVGLIALLNRDDDYHQNARAVFTNIGQLKRNVVTTNLVLAELGNGLARTGLREDVVWLIRELHRDASATVVHTDQGQFFEAVQLYLNRKGEGWGLVDCVSFVVMKRRGILDAFTADRHFPQAGFNCLLTM